MVDRKSMGIRLEHLGGLEVDDQVELGRRLHRQVGGLLALEDAIDVAAPGPVERGADYTPRNSLSRTRRSCGSSTLFIRYSNSPRLSGSRFLIS